MASDTDSVSLQRAIRPFAVIECLLFSIIQSIYFLLLCLSGRPNVSVSVCVRAFVFAAWQITLMTAKQVINPMPAGCMSSVFLSSGLELLFCAAV